ncbi:MAG: hypothetical protein WC718_08385 [Phycisphaerales bacterium]|jgi:hypothetical protein
MTFKFFTHVVPVASLAALVLLAGTVNAQPAPDDQPPPPRERGDDAPPREANPERAKAWVERMLKETRTREARLQEALERLNKGEAPEAILRDMTDERLRDAGLGGGPDGPGRPGGAGPEDGGRRGPLQRLRDRGRERAQGDGPGRPGAAGDEGPDDQMGPAGGPGERAGGREGGPKGGKAGRPGERLTPETKQEIHEFVKQNMPVLARRLELGKDDGEDRDRVLERLAPRILDAMAAKRRDPELFESRAVEIQAGLDVFDAVRAYRDAARDDKAPDHATKLETATKNLRSALERGIDARDKVRDREIDLLAKRVEKMRSELEKQRSDRDAKVADELKRIQKSGGKGPPPPPRPGDDDAGR